MSKLCREQQKAWRNFEASLVLELYPHPYFSVWVVVFDVWSV